MATATKESASKRNAGTKKTVAKRSSTKKSTTKKPAAKKATAKKATAKKNKLGVKNSLVNNINAHKKKGDSKSRKKSTVSKEAYEKMEQNWGEDKK